MMKAFSFLTILESLSKKLSILRTKMHSNNLRVDYESITSQLRVNPLFSHCASRRASFGTSRRVSHFAAILTILFTIGVGNVWGEITCKAITNPTGEVYSVTPATLHSYYNNGNGWVANGSGGEIESNSYYASKNGSSNKNYIDPETESTPSTNTAASGITIKTADNKSARFYFTGAVKVSAFIAVTGSSRYATLTIYKKSDDSQVTTINGKSYGSSGGYEKIEVAGLSSSESYYAKVTATNDLCLYAMKFFASSCNSSITPTLTYDNSNLILGQTITANPTLNKDGSSGDVTYSSSNTDVATVDENTGVVTAVGAGEATITATITANGDYCSGEATATITVNAASGGGDGDCPESGEIFALSGWSTSNTSEWKDKSLIETKITGLTTLTNGEVYAVSIEKDKKCAVNGSGENMAYSLGYNSVALRIDLDCELRVGDVITITSNGSHSNAFIFTNTNSRDNSVSSTTTSGTTKTYTVIEDDVLKGKKTIYIWRSSSTVNIKAINITRPASSTPETPTYTLTNTVNTNGYGTVLPASVSGIPSGTATSSSSNTYTVNGTTVTATPAESTAQYTYAFSSWSGLPATVTENATVTANFTRTVNKYTITWKNADGTTLETDNNVEYGATPAYNGTTPTKAADAQYTYTFEGWSPAISAVTGNAIYTATFTATPIETPEPEQVPQVGTFTGMGMSGTVNLYWTMPTRPVTTKVDIASATLSTAVGQSDGATSTNTKVNTNEIKVEYSTNGGWQATGVQIPLATSQTNVESITFEYKSASNQSVDLIPFLYDGTTRWVESGFAKLTPTEWTSHTSVITKQVWGENLYSKDKTIQSVNFYANPATATSGTFYIRNVVLNQGTQVAASGLIIVRKVDSNPTSPTDGTQVYNGDGIAATCTDDGLTDGTTYHYAAFAHDGQGNYSEPLYWQYTYTEGLNTYAPDDTDFPNPERGFYEQVQWNANKGYDAVIGDSYFNAARAASRSLILRIYYMDSDELRQNEQLPGDFITMFNADMEKFRTNGMKCILRFAYDENSGDGAHDASPETWATHLAQLKPHLEANADVIYVVQAGFLGVWGEWYYSSQGTGNDEIKLSIKNNLIDQLLAAVPANRCVQLRTPLFKKQYLDHNNALTSTEAYKGTAQARLGHHNDAFLNGEHNQGTYEGRTADMAYIAQECLFVPIGGETNLEESQVAELYKTYCEGTVAEAEMAQLHYSYLNHSYSTVVTNRWKAEGSYARMSKYMGYRFELTDATLPNEATAGTPMNVQLNIKNVGYAPLYNERYAYIVFKNNTNTYSIKLSSDPRTWAPNNAITAIDENVTLPVDMLEGTYDLYLYLPDASASIANNPKYAVRFANQGIWESETGYNKLNKKVEVTATDLPTYTITYNLNGGEGTEPTAQTAVEGQSVTLAAATGFSKAGHTFAGWSDGTNTYAAGATYTMPAENVTYTAKWNIISYTITFKNGETVLQESQVNYGETPAYNGANPTKAEDERYTYTFEGWSPEIATVTGNATYTATFAQTAKTYTLTWDVNGGNDLTGEYTTGSVAYGTTITKPADPTREGYTFAGWLPAVAATMPAANTTYTAQWNEIKVKSITVNPTTLDIKKGESATVTATISPADALNKTVTWTNTSITTLSSTTGATITVTGNSNGKEKELKASADGKQATVKVSVYYEVQYNSNDGSACTAGKYYEGNGVTLQTPTRDGYTFAGWYENEALTQFAGAADATYKPSDNITLYAKWTVAKTNPTTTWTVAETAYAGQLVTVSVATNSDAALTTSSLTTNKGTLVNATVNGQTITATLQVPGDASGTITLTLTTAATENYNASTSTKTITLSECPTNGSGGASTIFLWKHDGTSTYGGSNGVHEMTGEVSGKITFVTYESKKTSNDDIEYNAAVTDSDLKPSITKALKLGNDGAHLCISPSSGNFKAEDVIYICGYEPVLLTTTNSEPKQTSDIRKGTVLLASLSLGTEKPDCNVGTLTLPANFSETDKIYISRVKNSVGIAAIKVVRPSSGSGESTLETNLAWSTDLSAGVSKQAGNTFTYTASSNNSAGAITYSSSNTSVATVNPTTGEVTTKAAGTAIITATIAEIGCYPTKSITYTLTVTSTGTPEPGSYTLTYDENKPAVWVDEFAIKNIPAAQTLTNGTGNVSTNTPVITEAANSDYAIYDFAGWNTAANGTGTSYAAGDEITITENTILYAQWTPRTFDVKYFDEDKETPLEGMVNTTYTFGVGIPNLPTPTKPGHTFTGWHLFYDGEGGTIIEEPVVSLANDIWGVLQLAAQWDENCTMPTTTFANGRYVIGSGALDLRTLITDNTSGGTITYAVTGGVAATIDGYSFTCDRIGVVTVTATQAASGGYCEKIMTATINVAMPVTDGCAQMFTFDANDAITNPDGQKGQKYLDLSSYATINGLSTTGKVGIKDMTTNTSTNTTLIKNSEIYFPNTNTYLKVENLSTPLAAGDKISIGTQQSATTEYIITLAGTQCTENCITTAGQQYTILAESPLIGVTTFYIWSANAERYLKTIDICRPAYEITYMANNGTEEAESLDNAVLVAGCPNTFTVPAGKQFAGWNTAADGTGTSYSVGTIILENDLKLYAQWKCIEPVFTVSCDKTAYAKDEADPKPITVSVTAGNSGGVTYQWYSSTTNDRTTGSEIPGKTNYEYEPATDKEGTTYYWCKISNSCTTVKTPTVAITVTVTKNNPAVTWTNPTDVNYGGGGYSISATVNNEWNGTLLPSMLTAPTGINLYDIEINGKTITAKFDVTTTFDRTADKIPFVLTLPETTTYNPLVSEKKVSYDACDNGGGSKYRIPVKKESDQQDINPYNRWDTENIGWITWDQGGGTISSESATYDDFSYRTKSGKQVILIYSKIQEVKTIRIYGYGSNATECTAVSVGKEYNKYTKLSASEYAFNGNTINNRENGVIEISFTTPLKEGTYVQFNFSKNALFYGVELETEGGEKIETTLSFATTIPPKTQNDANFTNKATPSNNTLGTITYSSSNTDVATVNSTTGEVSIIAAGTTTITATLAPSGCYQGAKATYELTVTEEICDIAAGTLTASKTDKYNCEEVTLTLSNYEQGATIEWWHNGEAINSNGNTLTTTLDGTYSVLVTKGCSVRSNSVTITNIASASATPLVNEWYIKSGRLTPPIALWKLEGGARKAGVVWMRGEEVSNDAPYDNLETAIYEENGIVYLTGTPPQANSSAEDIRYTIQLSIKNSCDDTPMVVTETITIVHQKKTDKHVLAFVVTGKENGGFTEGITTAQTTNVALYNEISQVFDVLATNIYATDNEQLLKEYYSRFDIICITDYPDSKKTGVNGKSYTNAMGALIDIRPILSMEAWVSKYSNWNDKGVTGDPKSPTTRQYSMLLQCKDHEIFAGTNLIQEGSGDELMYRVTMVDKNQEQYKTLDAEYGATTPHAEKATTKIDGEETITGYGYGSNPALQGFTYTSAMSSMLPIGTIDDGDGNNLQVGLERQYEIEARMIVLGVNSYAMERLTDDGERVIVNTLKYLMKKQSSEIADCSIYFDNNNGQGDYQWNNPANWAPSRNSLPQASQEARILAPCIVSDVVAKVASIKIVPDGKYAPAYNGGIDAKGSLTIAPDGALVVGGHIQAATAPNYLEARPTTPENLIVQADATGSGALIHGEENGELGATVELVSKAYSVKEFNEQTGKYKKKKYWQYVALPVREALAEDAFWGAYTYQYDEAKGWIKKGTGERIEEFWGVGLSIDNEVYSGANNEQALTKFTIKGNLALAIDRDIDLTRTTNAGEGQNMIGNSWTAPIHLTSMTADDFENATATVYIYNTGRDEQASGSIGTASSANGSTQAGQWISIPVAATALDPWQGPKVIPAMQAFEVDLAEDKTSGILHLNYDKHVRTIATPEEENLPLRAPKYPSDRPSMIRLRVADSTTYTDLYLIEGDQFTDEFDNAWDGKYQPCDGRSATLYAMSPIGDMAVLAQQSVNNTSVVFEPGKKSEYVFTFGYDGDVTYYLNDMQLKTSTEIKEGNEYRFTYNKGDMKNRFLVTRESFDSPNISTGLANIVTDGNGLQVTNPNQENLQVILIDAAGRLCSIYNTAEPMFNIELPATQGVYMINVKGETTNIVRKVVK